MAVILKGTNRQKLEYCFRIYGQHISIFVLCCPAHVRCEPDRDGDGLITKDDLYEILSHLPIQKVAFHTSTSMHA